MGLTAAAASAPFLSAHSRNFEKTELKRRYHFSPSSGAFAAVKIPFDGLENFMGRSGSKGNGVKWRGLVG